MRPHDRDFAGDTCRRRRDQVGLGDRGAYAVCRHGALRPDARCLRPRRDGHCDQYRRRGGYPPGFHGAETLFRPFAALFRGAVQRVVDGHVARLPLRRRVRFEHGARRVADFRGEGLREVNGEAVRSGRGKSPEVRRSGIINGGQPE